MLSNKDLDISEFTIVEQEIEKEINGMRLYVYLF